MKRKIITALFTLVVLSFAGCASREKELPEEEQNSTVDEEFQLIEEIEDESEVAFETETEDESVSETESISQDEEDASITEINISDDVYSWQVALDGVTYTFPTPVSELLEDGWTLAESGTLDAHVVDTIGIEKDSSTYSEIMIINNTEEILDYAECSMYGINPSMSKYAQIAPTILPGKLEVNADLTSDMVIEKYGDPTTTDINDQRMLIEYRVGEDQFMQFLFEADGTSPYYFVYQRR